MVDLTLHLRRLIPFRVVWRGMPSQSSEVACEGKVSSECRGAPSRVGDLSTQDPPPFAEAMNLPRKDPFHRVSVFSRGPRGVLLASHVYIIASE